MSAEYRPDASASPVPPWNIVYLANRDLAAAVPINFVTQAGISLSSACFFDGVFESSRAAKCLSNLLAARFSRVVVDLYWDPGLRQLSLCPLSLGKESPQQSLSSTGTGSDASVFQSSLFSPQSRSNIESPSLTRVSETGSTITDRNEIRLVDRQVESLTLSPTSANTTEPSSTFVEAVPISTSPADVTLYQVGSYQCSSTLNLRFVASLVMDYIQQTSDTLSANLLFFQFNLHAAASTTNSSNQPSALSGSDLPSSDELVGHTLGSVFSSSLYYPSELQDQRANLDDSWYSLSPSKQPISQYFTISPLSDAKSNTPDGWPNEYFTELDRFNRILFGWGSIEPQMESYNFTGDRHIIFPLEEFASPRDMASSSAGPIDSVCFYDPAQTRVGQVNSSWAVSNLTDIAPALSSGDQLWSLARNLTSCGITPVLDMPLDNQTAQQNASQYMRFVQSTVWNWASGEPRKASLMNETSGDDEGVEAESRCGLMITSLTSDAGRWRVEHCGRRHQVACRVADQPYMWRLSSNQVPFSESQSACSGDTAFSVPRTGLENTYLYQHFMSLPDESRSELVSDNSSGVWINLNSLDAEACWVTTGPDGTCPYIVDEEAITARTVLVPTIAALVVLALTALTLFVKCNKNRRNSRKRVRGEGGWDYEGVPN